MKASKRNNKIFKLLSVIAILYVAMIITFSFIHPNVPVQLFQSINLNGSFISGLLFTWDNVYQTIETIYPGVLRLFLLTTLFLSLYGWFVLSRGKNIIEVFLLFVVYLIPKPEEYWGKVLDKTTFKVLPFTTLRVTRRFRNKQTDEFVTETITDLFGRYRLNINKEQEYQYFLHVNIEGYKQYQREILDKESGLVSVYDDIFLVPFKQDYSTLQKFLNELKTHMNTNISNYLYLASLLSLLVSIRSIIIAEIPPGNYVHITQYVIAVVINTWRTFKLNNISIGKIILYNENKVLPNIAFQLRDGSKVVEKEISDESGVVTFHVSPGIYELELADEQYEIVNSENSNLKKIEVLISDKGFLRNNIILKNKVHTENFKPNLNLMNPFS